MRISSIMWAVHISDGVLHWPWVVAGFLLIGLLALLSAWRVSEDEVPRIALMSAAFFVASSIHVKLGPTSAHLLLNGLVGIILGWRAPLAILIGVTLQALLIAHGGVSMIGVNACTQALPALFVAALFPSLYSLIHGRHPWIGSLLVAAGVIVWGACLVLAVSLVGVHGLRGSVNFSDRAGVEFSLAGLDQARESLAPAIAILIRPVTLAGLAALGLLAVVLERIWPTAPDFALGAFLGVVSVLTTTLLVGAVLIADAADRWQPFVSAVLIVQLQIALVEGVILGCTIGFLSRVKPEMLRVTYCDPSDIRSLEKQGEKARDAQPQGVTLSPRQPPPPGITFLIALLVMFMSTSTALAHRLLADHKVDLANRRVQVESWYETDDIPREARARVLRSDGSILAEGALDAGGKFVFAFEKVEPLTVEITAPGGHRASCKIQADELKGAESDERFERPSPSSKKKLDEGESHAVGENRFHQLIVGVSLLLATAAFVMSWNNHRRLRQLQEDRRE